MRRSRGGGGSTHLGNEFVLLAAFAHTILETSLKELS